MTTCRDICAAGDAAAYQVNLYCNALGNRFDGRVESLTRRKFKSASATCISKSEKDVSYYADTRDLVNLPHGANLSFYTDLKGIRNEVKRELGRADLALCTSFCPDGPAASELILDSRAGIKAFYDLNTPATLDGLSAGADVSFLPAQGLGDFDIVLSYTGGWALAELKTRLGARAVAPLYGSVDPENHRPVSPREEFRSALSYLGTYAEDK